MPKETSEKIYHFTILDTVIEHILPNMQLRTNSLKNMNDPKESQLLAFNTKVSNLKLWYPDTYSSESHFEHQFKLGHDIRQSVQAICFVKDSPKKGYLNEMMWAHYAENHRGICLEIDSNVFMEENQKCFEDNPYWLEDMGYSGSRKSPYLCFEHGMTKEEAMHHIIQTNYKELFFSKSTYWERENEKRLVVKGENYRYLSIKNSCNYSAIKKNHELLTILD